MIRYTLKTFESNFKMSSFANFSLFRPPKSYVFNFVPSYVYGTCNITNQWSSLRWQCPLSLWPSCHCKVKLKYPGDQTAFARISTSFWSDASWLVLAPWPWTWLWNLSWNKLQIITYSSLWLVGLDIQTSLILTQDCTTACQFSNHYQPQCTRP